VTDYLIGVDLGSSDCKVIITDTHGEIIASSASPYPTHHPRFDWVEQEPQEWYRVACQTIKTTIQAGQIAPERILALSIDGPAHNVALMAADGEVLCPTIHWSDLRSTPQAERLEAEYGRRIFELTFSRVNPSWTLTQLMWLRENEPGVWSKLRRILVTKDYLRYRFTGLYLTDPYDAIGTQLYDVRAGRWSAELCQLVEFDLAWLPSIASPTEIGGTLLPQAARDSGLPVGLPVAVGSGDSVVEAFGIGAIKPGQCLIKLGTAANVNLVTAQPYPSPQSITYRHVVEPHWFTITATNSGAATMRWFRDTFCRHEVLRATTEGVSVYELIDQLGIAAPPGSQGLIFHPYLMGERSPHWDPHLRGDFVGISAQHTVHHFARAILEGVAFSIRDCLQVVESLGEPPETYSLIGGGTRSRLWCQVLCDVLGVPLVKPSVEDAAFGAALLAGVAVGVFPDMQSAARKCARVAEIFQPDTGTHELYDEYFEVYCAVTHDLRAHSHRLARLAERTIQEMEL
jgi:xylulokinase